MNITVSLTDAQLEELALRVAEILAGKEPAPEFLTVDAAASMAGVSPRTVANWISRGRLTRWGVPRHPMVSRLELLALLAPESPSDGGVVRPRRPGKPRPASGAFTAIARRA